MSAEDVAAERRRQEIAQIRDYFAQLHRLDTVAYRIHAANHEDCKKRVTGLIGLLAVTPQSLPQKYRSFSAEALGLNWTRATVVSVVEGSPAAAAGIVNGDELMTFNNEVIPVSRTPRWLNAFLSVNRDKPVTVVLKRNGEDRTVDVKPVMGCSIPVELDITPDANASTSAERIVIHTGLLRLARTDDQLAAVVGHDLAHSNLGHLDKQFQNTMFAAAGGALVDGGFLLGGIYTGQTFTNYMGHVGSMMHSVDFEREADYVGSYYAARAGYSIVGAEEIWQAMAMEAPNMIRVATTHPTAPVRFLQMRKTAEEIADKQRRDQPLVPEPKMIKVDTAPTTAQDVH